VAASSADVVKHILDAFDRLMAKAPLDLRLAPWTPPPPSYHTQRVAKKGHQAARDSPWPPIPPPAQGPAPGPLRGALRTFSVPIRTPRGGVPLRGFLIEGGS
jgi:hypothetical protein